VTRLARAAWATLAYTLLVILWGAYVRASGSGAGCGEHWPLCNGEVLPRAPQLETLIELTHRVTSGVALLAVVALVVLAFRVRPAAPALRRAALASLFFMLTEAAVGAGLVLFQLVADNESMARALFMAVHLANTFLLVGALTVLALLASGVPAPAPGRNVRLAWMLGAGLLASIVAGASGAVAALGDTLFPASSLAEALARELSPTSHLLIRLRLLHPTLAVAAGVILVVAARLAARRVADGRTERAAWLVQGLVAAQLLVGVVSVALLAPIWLQLVHLLAADLLWMATVTLTVSALAPLPAGARSAAPLVAVHSGLSSGGSTATNSSPNRVA
jgi:cytochrome c oxidase assembly protein subunit 15